MIDIADILDSIGSRLSDELKQAILTKQLERVGVNGSFQSPYNATGNLANSVRFDIRGSILTVYADDYIYYGENGRKNGKRPPINVIKQWISDKGIVPTDISVDSLAFLIARKIGQEGTTIFRAGGKSGLVSDTFNDRLVESIEFEFANLIFAEASSEIVKLAA